MGSITRDQKDFNLKTFFTLHNFKQCACIKLKPSYLKIIRKIEYMTCY